MSQASTLERQMLNLINEERADAGLKPVKLEQRLNDSSEDHSRWMLSQDKFSHTGANGSSAGDRIKDAGFTLSGSWTWAENIAWQSERGPSGLADDVVNLHTNLMNSPGHRANILNKDVAYIGIGLERGDFNGYDAVMVTQNFARTSAPVNIDNGGGSNNGGGNSGPGAGADVLKLSSAGTLKGFGGNDRLTGSGGADKLLGGDGADAITGGGGRDIMRGGNGNDRLYGNNGDDVISGGNGNDRVNGGGGDDRLSGNAGNDVFVFTSGRDILRDFNEHNGAEDIDLGLARGINNFADLRANHMTQRGDHVVIEDTGGNIMLIRDAKLGNMDAGDFLF